MVKRVFVLVSFVVAILVIVGNAFAQDKTPEASIPEPSLGPEWKLVARDSNLTTVYVDERSITYLPKGIVKVRILWVPRGETRRKLVNALKKRFFSEGKDPSKAERLWYEIDLYKVNCKTHQTDQLEDIAYSFGQVELYDKSFQYEKWEDIIHGSVGEGIEKYVCNEAPLSPPELSLSSEWKLVFKSKAEILYVNTRKITYLPKGIVKVWTLSVPRKGLRKAEVNLLKNDLLSEGKDPSKAERLWYENTLYKFNCKTNQFDILKEIFYSFGRRVLDSDSSQYEEWISIIPGMVEGEVEKYVCNETPPLIPEPSLSSKWKPLSIDFDWTTVYVNTRSITYLPKGIVKIWTLFVPRGEDRRVQVNALKQNLTSKGEDPNNAERLWYEIILYKVNCETHQFATLEYIAYSLGKTLLGYGSTQYEKWVDIPPGSLIEKIEKYACK